MVFTLLRQPNAGARLWGEGCELQPQRSMILGAPILTVGRGLGRDRLMTLIETAIVRPDQPLGTDRAEESQTPKSRPAGAGWDSGRP